MRKGTKGKEKGVEKKKKKEAKEIELAKKGEDTEKSKKDGNKDQSHDGDGMDDNDADMNGNREVYAEEGDDGDEVGNGEVVSSTVTSTGPIPLPPLLSPATSNNPILTTSGPSSTVIAKSLKRGCGRPPKPPPAASNNPILTTSGPSSSSTVITKLPKYGRGRPPKHLTYANPALTPASSSTVTSSKSKGGMKNMTSGFKCTTSTTDNKWETQSRGWGKGKGKRKGILGVDAEAEDVALSVSAVVVVKGEGGRQVDSRIEDDICVKVEDEQPQPQSESEPLYEYGRLGDLLEGDDDMEEETVQREGGGEENVNGPRNDRGEIGSFIVSESRNSSSTPMPTIMDSNIPAHVQLEVQQFPSFSVESFLFPMVPVDLQDPTNVIPLSPNETYPMSTQVWVAIPPYDSYGCYTYGHLNSPIVEQHRMQEQTAC